jgi:hypothetical protein
MPIPDLTIDTNVLLHSCNPVEGRHKMSLEFVSALLGCAANLAIDEGFDLNPAKNRSLIGAEYLTKLVPGTLPSYVVTQLALSGRISVYKCSVCVQHTKKLNQLVSNKRDRSFVKVCANSTGKVMVSHDFKDFSDKKRKDLGNLFTIQIVEASDCAHLI